jgi:hypothetical protein
LRNFACLASWAQIADYIDLCPQWKPILSIILMSRFSRSAVPFEIWRLKWLNISLSHLAVEATTLFKAGMFSSDASITQLTMQSDASLQPSILQKYKIS